MTEAQSLISDLRSIMGYPRIAEEVSNCARTIDHKQVQRWARGVEPRKSDYDNLVKLHQRFFAPRETGQSALTSPQAASV